MKSEDDGVKTKALLLLQREGELFRVRAKHEQLTSWLRLAQTLPQLIDRHLSIDAIYGRLRKALITGLKIPSVVFLEVRETTLRPIAPAGPERPCDEATLSLCRVEPWGSCDDAQDGPTGVLTQILGLHRFLWGRIEVPGTPPVLLVAGYTRDKAKYHPGFDTGDPAHLGNTAKYIETLLSLHAANDQLHAANQTLEQKVRERTEQVEHRNRDMRLVLDNVEQAFLTVDRDGNLAEERSAIVDRWFGPYAHPVRFVDYIAVHDAEFALHFELGHAALLEDFLPRQLCIDQLPSTLKSRERQFRCSYTPLVSERDREGALLIVINDVTDHVRHIQEESEQKELLSVSQGLMGDRTGYMGFFDEATELVAQVMDESVDLVTRRRLLHTLKGNAAMFGAHVVSALCDRVESEIDLDGAGDRVQETLAALQGRWRVIANIVGGILGERGRDIVEVPTEAIDGLCADVIAGAAQGYLTAKLASWKFEPVERCLNRLAQHGSQLARRLGKGNITTVVRAPELRLDPERWSSLWSALVHVVRNAADHGLESPVERAALEKPTPARIEMTASLDGDAFVITIRDDGRGIDWARVGALAAQRGLAHATREDLVRALLVPAFTVREAATTTSGRGMGMTAVDAEVRNLGGAVEVDSPAGAGTEWRFSFPASAVVPLGQNGNPIDFE